MPPNGHDNDPPNLGRLIRLLKLTTSSNDAEALSAIRKANQQLLKFGGDWEALLSSHITVIGDPFDRITAPPPSMKRPPPAPPRPPRPQSPPPPPPPPIARQWFEKTSAGTWQVASTVLLSPGDVVEIPTKKGVLRRVMITTIMKGTRSAYLHNFSNLPAQSVGSLNGLI